MEERVILYPDFGTTVINPLGLCFAIIMWSLIIFLKKEYKIIPYLLLGCLMPTMQHLVIFNISFTYLRIAIIIGILIALIDGRYEIKFNKIDKIMIWYGVSYLFLHTILAGIPGLIEKAGNVGLDTVVAYFVVRYFAQDIKKFDIIMKTLVVASIVIAIFMLNEKLTGRNWFSMFGGVPEFTEERLGKLRAQAAIDHPILAGTIGALLIPFMWVLWNLKKKLYAVLGTISGVIITFTSASSGPVLTLMSGIGGLFLWRYREKRSVFFKIIILILIVLQIFMQSPVWFIFAKVDLAGGSTGYHRSLLIDMAIRHFKEWILFGTMASGSWSWGLQDTTNQYLKVGFQAGLTTFVLFVYVIVLSFKTVGKSLVLFKDSIEDQKTTWALGVLLFAHCVTFFGVSYFGNMQFYYFMLLAMISSLNNYLSDANVRDQIKI